ncbi:hypothetical protein [Streptomyces violascens]|uniref:hypothetical protein n=1 Tax=Streptomyces violascens TaxID=67381 RepID=UPI0036A02B9D
MATVVCPTCGAPRHAPCRSLLDRPLGVLHRGRIADYLALRCGPLPAGAHPHGAMRSAFGSPPAQPWRLPLADLSDLLAVSFPALVMVATAQACGAGDDGLDRLLFAPDRLPQSVDALLYALHDRQLRQEARILAGRRDPIADELGRQHHALRERLDAAQAMLKNLYTDELTAAGILPFPRPSHDTRHIARAWLGRYLQQEKEALVHAAARRLGVPCSASRPIRNVRDKVAKCLDNRWILAPRTAPVEAVLALDDQAFARLVREDAAVEHPRQDTLGHPLLVNRWRDQLTTVLCPLAAGVRSAPAELTPLTRGELRASGAEVGRLTARRRHLAALVRRREESTRLITELNHVMLLAERGDPSHRLIKEAGDTAFRELERRHPDIFRHIHARLARHADGRGLLRLSPPQRSALRREVFAELDERFGSLRGAP